MSTPARGRRVAVRAARRVPEAGTMVAAGLVLATVASALLLRSPSGPEVPEPGVAAAVSRTTLVCPGPATGRSRDTRAVASVPLPEVTDEGEVTAGPLDGSRVAVPLRRGDVRALPPTAAVVEAGGDLAAGLVAVRQDRTSTDTAAAACVPAGSRWWFAGAGAGLDHSSRLTLVNVDPGPAVVDVRLLGAQGEIPTVGTRGLTLAPGEQRVLSLTEIAPGSDEVTVAVTATRGRVAAAMLDRWPDRTSSAAGLEWLPGSAGPARSVTLAGIPVAAGPRTLLVSNPGELEALVDVELAGARGTFVPTGAGTVTVAPGAVTAVDLSGLLPRGEAVAVRVSAQVPVVATVRSVVRGVVGHAAAAPRLTTPAATVVPAGALAAVHLSAGAAGSRVEVVAYDARGRELRARTVAVGPGATVDVSSPSGTELLVVTPLAGAVQGAVVWDHRGGGASSWPLLAVPHRVRVPQVVPGPR